MTAEIINQRHFWKDIGSSNFLFPFFKNLNGWFEFFPENWMILRSGIHGPRETDQGWEKNLERDQNRKTGGPWIPIYDKAIF